MPRSRRVWTALLGVLLLVCLVDMCGQDPMRTRFGRKSMLIGLPVALLLIYSGLRR